jgi:dimethylargininase
LRTVALTRKVSATLAGCELEFAPRQPIDVAKAIEQHDAYEAALLDLGVNVVSLPSDDRFPDGVFVEDPAVVLDQVGVIGRMAAASRRDEISSVADTLAPYRELRFIKEPALLEGGDVIRVGQTLYVGESRRTNRDGINQLAALLQPYGYRVRAVPVHGCLHLKTACCPLGDGHVLANRNWFDASTVDDPQWIDVPAEEPWAANVLRIGGTVVVPQTAPRTTELLMREGYAVRTLDISELQKAEAGLTCMSVVFEDHRARHECV